MKVYQHVNIVTCDQDFHVHLDGILAVKDSQIVYVGQEKQEILNQAGRSDYRLSGRLDYAWFGQLSHPFCYDRLARDSG